MISLPDDLVEAKRKSPCRRLVCMYVSMYEMHEMYEMYVLDEIKGSEGRLALCRCMHDYRASGFLSTLVHLIIYNT